MRWNRRVLKAQGKAAFRRNYWRGVLAAMVLTLTLAGAAAFSGSSISENITFGSNSGSSVDKKQSQDGPEGWEYREDYGSSSGKSSSQGNFQEIPGQGSQDSQGSFSQIPSPSGEEFSSGQSQAGAGTVFGGLLSVLLFLIGAAVVILLRIFILNPMEIGAKRFFVKNLHREPGEIREIAYVFDHSWKNAGMVLFFRDLQIFLWSLLLVIPGIVKAYEYRMIPYLMAENPAMDRKTAFALSRQMMDGEKWHTFVLDLSFLGWNILSGLTLGLVGIFWSNPYQYSTNAVLYATLRYRRPQQNAGSSDIPPQGTTAQPQDRDVQPQDTVAQPQDTAQPQDRDAQPQEEMQPRQEAAAEQAVIAPRQEDLPAEDGTDIFTSEE